MPLHIFLSTWFGSSFSLLEPARVLKDLVMFIGFLVAFGLSYKEKWFREFIKNKLIWLIAGYGLLTLILAIFRKTDQDAEILGVVYNTRFLVFFIYAALLSNLNTKNQLRKDALVAVLGAVLAVLVFGLIQYTLMPSSFLEHFGYMRGNGVLPAFFIDDKPDLERIMSTLRDPNSYGSYLIIIGSLVGTLLLKNKTYRNIAIGFLSLTLLNLIFTFSRSAWIGFVVSVLVVLVLALGKGVSREHIRKTSLVLASLGIVFGLVLVASWNSYFVQNVIFHADESTVLEDPNELRIRFWKESVKHVISDPIGSGPGTAGLASIRNNIQGAELNENYYLQVASEVGVIGLILFISILVTTALKLLKLAQDDWLALALLASFAGLLVTNFLVHIWSNEAVAYTWWGLAGIATSRCLIANKKRS